MTLVDAILSWFGRIWITIAVLGMLVFYFGLPDSLTEDWALFHIAWAPVFAVPNPVNVLWWVATVIVVSPGACALLIRDKLRRMRATSSAERTLGRIPSAKP